jgi:hypothetical protein
MSSSAAAKKPKELKPFGEKTFWDDFYKTEAEPFDWYMEFSIIMLLFFIIFVIFLI